jgi:hypothetical protein
MDVVLAPVYEYFLEYRTQCLGKGGFVVGPMGVTTAEDLFDFAVEVGIRDKEVPHRFTFDPWLAGAVYESHVTDGSGAFRYIGLVDEIEINNDGHSYRFPDMKPGEGTHGEEKFDERMPAFIRFRLLNPVSDVIPGSTQLWPRDLGLSETTLRRFKVGSIRSRIVREAFERLRSP